MESVYFNDWLRALIEHVSLSMYVTVWATAMTDGQEVFAGDWTSDFPIRKQVSELLSNPAPLLNIYCMSL